ncbi:hypothetical protein [Salmonirosea aquatica]|uniref:hypothetical protein n=1 Tax=Salmonirosea aquatica TaxID=2654236 RepID=UPI004032D18E
MAEDKMMRLSQVARILNVGISTIVDHLSANGYKVETNPNTKINAAQIDFLAKDFNSEKLRTSGNPPKPAAAPEIQPKGDQRSSGNDEILYFRTSPTVKPAEKEEEVPAVKPAEAPSPLSESRLPGIKVVGKIDLNARKPVVPPPVAPPKTEANEPRATPR